jgi:HEAT repeat protein
MAGEIDELLKNLQRPFSRAQRRAEEGLVRVGEAAIEPVATLLFSESADISTQSAAFDVLERIGGPRVIPHMLRLVKGSRYNDYSAARYLARQRDPALLASLLEVAAGPDRHRAAAALTGLGECGERSILPELVRIIESRKDEARLDAMQAAAKLGGHDAFEAIAPLLKDPDASTRGTAARLLTEMKHPQAARHIADALRIEEVDFPTERMAKCLIELNAADSLPIILEALGRVQDKSALHEPMRKLRGGIPADISPYLKDADPDVRIATAIVLGNSGRIEAVAPLLTARTDSEYKVRQEVRTALKTLRRSGVSFSVPRASIRDRAAVAVELLATYFHIPSSEGFSAYRTGWIAHFGFSAIVAAIIFTVASGALGLQPLSSAAAALAGVILLWGVGALVGVYSHYNPLIMIGVIGVIIALFVKGSTAIALGIPIALAGHFLMIPFAFILKLLRRILT